MARVTTVEPKIAQTAPKEATDCTIANQYDWDYATAYAICMAESGGNEKAYNPSNSNGTNDAGLFQINSIHVTSGLIGNQDRFNGTENVSAAYRIYLGSGWNAWSAYNNGAYLKHL